MDRNDKSNDGVLRMKLARLNKNLKDRNISLKDFDITYIIPYIKFENNKEIVEEFEIKFQRKSKNVDWD